MRPGPSSIRTLLGGMSSVFSRRNVSVPATYDPSLHYNCFLESAVRASSALPQYGVAEIQQMVFQELRRRGTISASHLLPDGRLQLIVSDLGACIDAHRAVIESLAREIEASAAVHLGSLRRERDELSAMSPEGIMLFVYHEPEPLETVRLDVYLRTVNEVIESKDTDQEPLAVFRTAVDRLQRSKAHVRPETTLLYESRVGDYWHFLFLHAIDEAYVYGQNDRKVQLPYVVDKAGMVVLTAVRSVQRELFSGAKDLTERELKGMLMAYTYRPYAETRDELLARPGSRPGG